MLVLSYFSNKIFQLIEKILSKKIRLLIRLFKAFVCFSFPLEDMNFVFFLYWRIVFLFCVHLFVRVFFPFKLVHYSTPRSSIIELLSILTNNYKILHKQKEIFCCMPSQTLLKLKIDFFDFTLYRITVYICKNGT